MRRKVFWTLLVVLQTVVKGEYLGDKYVDQVMKEVTEQVDASLDRSFQKVTDPNVKLTPSLLLKRERFPDPMARRLARAQEIIELTIEKIQKKVKEAHPDFTGEVDDLLSGGKLDEMSNTAGCLTIRQDVDCSDSCFHQHYRTFDGTCNNHKHPLWGASLTPCIRLIPAVYEGLNKPLGWTPDKKINGFVLPGARSVSSLVMSTTDIGDDGQCNYMLMQWGQFLVHDTDLIPHNPSMEGFISGIPCDDNCKNEMPCFPIPIPKNDPRIKTKKCLGFTRSSAVCGSGHSLKAREQMNQISSYLDGSAVYGPTDALAEKMRDPVNRMLLKRGNEMTPGKHYLPYDEDAEFAACNFGPKGMDSPCYLAGDNRANEQPGLIAMHTLWVREHNRLALELHKLNPQWSSETIFQQARKIVVAQIQHISYEHWLPFIFGRQGMKQLGQYKSYDPDIDASMINSFSTAAARFGHAMVVPLITRLGADWKVIKEGNLPLHRSFFAPFKIKEGGIDPVIRGFLHDASKQMDPTRMVSDVVTERLFEQALDVALDLAALNIQRGRDHGIPSYTKMLQYCGLSSNEVKTWEELKAHIRKPQLLQKLKELYGDPRNIDLWVGGLSEDNVMGGRVGPVFLCIMIEQFRRLREGDRFYYENSGQFTAPQLAEIRKSTLARIICDNSDAINEVQPDALCINRPNNQYTKCDNTTKIPRLDLTPWKNAVVPSCSTQKNQKK